MQGNRSRNTVPEVRLRSALHRSGLRFFKHRRPQPGISCRVDILFPAAHLAVFVDGCFWHCCPEHGTRPAANTWYWEPKLRRNVERDRAADAALQAAGWTVVRFWEHESVDAAVDAVTGAVGAAAQPRTSVTARPRPCPVTARHGT